MGNTLLLRIFYLHVVKVTSVFRVLNGLRVSLDFASHDYTAPVVPHTKKKFKKEEDII